MYNLIKTESEFLTMLVIAICLIAFYLISSCVYNIRKKNYMYTTALMLPLSIISCAAFVIYYTIKYLS